MREIERERERETSFKERAQINIPSPNTVGKHTDFGRHFASHELVCIIIHKQNLVGENYTWSSRVPQTYCKDSKSPIEGFIC